MPDTMKLFIAALLALPTLALAQVMYQGADREKVLAEGAKKEGEVMLYTSLVPEDLTALAAAFEKKYGVKLKTWRANSEKVLQRAVTEARAGRNDADIIETAVSERRWVLT